MTDSSDFLSLSERSVVNVRSLMANHRHLHLLRSGTAGPRNPKGILCGTPKFASACPVKSHEAKSLKFGFNYCGCMSCKPCMPAQARKLAKRATAYYEGAHHLYLSLGHKVGPLCHVPWSPPPDRYSQESVEADGGKKFLADYRKIFDKALGNSFQGGASVPHYWRKKHVSDGSECDFKPFRRSDGSLARCPKGRHKWVWGPHVHYVGHGWFHDGKTVFEDSGWIYEKLKDDQPRSFFDTMFYLLTHCGLFVDDSGKQVGQIVRWNGSFSKGKVAKYESERVDVPHICPVKDCGEQTKRYEIPKDGGLIDRATYFGECHHREVHYHYFIRERVARPKVLVQKDVITNSVPVAPPPSKPYFVFDFMSNKKHSSRRRGTKPPLSGSGGGLA